MHDLIAVEKIAQWQKLKALVLFEELHRLRSRLFFDRHEFVAACFGLSLELGFEKPLV